MIHPLRGFLGTVLKQRLLEFTDSEFMASLILGEFLRVEPCHVQNQSIATIAITDMDLMETLPLSSERVENPPKPRA
jgi:hypothetical protein